ncbi:MAG: AAA domain-containing protein [Tabrizicola sp.]
MPTDIALPTGTGNAAAPDPAALLRYYAATQRRDPRGSVEVFPDQHGTKWHLFDAHGPWWDGRTASIPAGLLEPGFRQALGEAGGKGSAAAGWPIGVFRDAEGTRCLPLLLLPVDWQLGSDRLTFRADRVQPALNPAIVRPIRQLTGLSNEALVRALEPGEDDAGLGSAGARLAHLLARIGGGGLVPGSLAAEMVLRGDGLRNTAALFLPDEASFTRRLAQDLDRMAGWPSERLAQTALAEFLTQGKRVEPGRLADPLELSALTERQFAAADAALSGAPAAIQGPPGTGKSQVIAGLIVSALAAGKSVLFAARNHRALDEVESRLAEVLKDPVLLVRTRDADGERDTGMFEALVGLTDGDAATDEQAAADRRRILTEAARQRTAHRRAEAIRTRLHLALADLLERQHALAEARAAAGLPEAQSREPGFLLRLRNLLHRLAGRRRTDPLTPLPPDARLDEITRRIADLRHEIDRLPEAGEPPAFDPAPHLAALAAALAAPDADVLRHLRARRAEIEFERGRPRQERVTREDALQVLRHRPIWLASTLSVPARIPLEPGLFDLAIFDESSQCDIASALAVMARARSAVVVGDPEQLSFIPALGKEQEHSLMDAAGLPPAGRARWAQSQNSLFDLARNCLPAEALHLLPDQFRSAPDIVDYTSQVFYGGRLRARRADDSFRTPRGWRPGLHWQDVRGPCSREDGGNVNRTEAEWIARRLAELACEEGFEGSVGVVSPFNAQVGLIRRLAGTSLTEKARKRLKLVIDTVDGWQGGEADVIFLSLAVGPGAAQSAIGFLQKDRRRFNVAVSRARALAVVVGDLDWARGSGIAHLEILARRATEPAPKPGRGFDSLWERRVNEALKARGLDATPQYPVGRRSLDFALFHGTVKLDLEVDGRKWHIGAGGERKTADRLRDRELIGLGWKVRRFWVDELAHDMEGCLDTVERDLGLRD